MTPLRFLTYLCELCECDPCDCADKDRPAGSVHGNEIPTPSPTTDGLRPPTQTT